MSESETTSGLHFPFTIAVKNTVWKIFLKISRFITASQSIPHKNLLDSLKGRKVVKIHEEKQTYNCNLFRGRIIPYPRAHCIMILNASFSYLWGKSLQIFIIENKTPYKNINRSHQLLIL